MAKTNIIFECDVELKKQAEQQAKQKGLGLSSYLRLLIKTDK